MTALSKLVRDRDLKHNTPRQLEVTARPTESKSICLACRRVPDVHAMRMDWYQKNRTDWGYQKKPWPGVGTKCPDCGGRLVEVSW